jgi:DNA mismatch repair protein MutS
MRQYNRIKEQHKDAILFFRMGQDDAIVASKALGLTLTTRNNGGAAEVPLAGVPVKAVDGYVKQLVEQGFKVAICEQLEDPKQAKGIVERGVVEVVTPGTALDEAMLERTRSTYLVALTSYKDTLGLAFVDCSTGEFGLAEPDTDGLIAELRRLEPAELLVPLEWRGDHPGPPVGVVADLVAAPPALNPIKEWKPDLPVSLREGWRFDPSEGEPDLCRRFGVSGLDGFGCTDFTTAIGAAGAIVHYVEEVQPAAVATLRPPKPLFAREHLAIDETTLANLELLEPLRDGGRKATLLGIIDHTVTAIGARRLRTWIARPLTDRETIVCRHHAVGQMVDDGMAREKVREALDPVHDLERLAGRVASGRANPRDLVALADTCRAVPVVRAILEELTNSPTDDPNDRWKALAAQLQGHPDVVGMIDEAVVEEPPPKLGEGQTIRDGYDPDLDQLRVASKGGREWIAKLQETERQRTAIPSLKVGFNKVFGYYLEVTKTHLAKVPDDWIRKQTISSQILGADEKIAAMEAKLFAELRTRIAEHATELQSTADALAETDVLSTLADVAARNNYCRPEITDEPGIAITAGRHPVVERWLEGEAFVPNDVALDSETNQLVILTGPNMAGKSTYLRQIGLITVLAQMGSWVPAESATIGIVDRLFTRVGASDSLARGQSTFLVEMIETANILHNATDRSLVLLDEIGRGTATFDGLAIAWAVSEHIHEGGAKPLTVFATHYHELTELEAILPRVKNYSIEVKEYGDEIVFLKRVKKGPSDRSYGIHVGRLAGLPDRVVGRAKEILANLEAGEWSADQVPTLATGELAPEAAQGPPAQITLIAAESKSDPLVESLRELDLDAMTPREAQAWLYEWRKRARSEKSND